jgi:hypothetical protein
MTAILKLTRGIGSNAESINLIAEGPGLHVSSWVPARAGYKGDAIMGIIVDSPLSDFVESRHARWGRIDEQITLQANARNQDDLDMFLSGLEDMLYSAAKFWQDEWSTEIVYITVKGKDETNPRYAVLYGGQTSNTPDIYNQPFIQVDKSSVSGEFTANIVRGHWKNEKPGVASCIGVMRNNTLQAYYENILDNLGVGETYEDAVVAWPLNETAGTTANAIIQGTWDGTYAGSYTLDNDRFTDNEPSTTFTSTGYVSFSGVSPLLSAWNGGIKDRGTISLWVKASAATWGNTTAGVLFSVTDDSGGVDVTFTIRKSTVANFLIVERTCGTNAQISANISNEVQDGGWINIAVIWDARSGIAPNTRFMELYVNGRRYGFTVRNLLPWSVDSDYMRLNSGHANIGVTNGLNSVSYANLTLFDVDIGGTDPLLAQNPRYILTKIINPNLWSEGSSCYGQTIANQYTNARIDYVYVRDNSPATWTDESDQSVPYNLLPSTPADNDAIYFGSEDSPFAGVMVDIDGGTGFTLTWQYWNGSIWTALSGVIDVSEGLHVDGETSISWDLPSNWVVNNPGMGVSAYWVRGIIITTSGEPSTSTVIQQNGQVFTLAKPYVDTQDTDIGGDIPASGLLKMDFIGPLTSNMVLIGKRGLVRGEEFSAYLNAGLKNLPPGVTSNLGNDASFVPDTSYPGLYYIQLDPSGTYGFGATGATTWTVGESVSAQYQGVYRAFLCVEYPDTMATGDAYLRLRYSSGYITTAYPPITPDPDAQNTKGTRYIDMGIFSVPRQSGGSFNITVDASIVSAGTWTMNIISLILIPIDEWAAEVIVPDAYYGSSTYNAMGEGDTLLIDSTSKTDLHGRTVSRLTDAYIFAPGAEPLFTMRSALDLSVTGPIEVTNRGQDRFWFFTRTYGNESPKSFNYSSVSMEGVKRYLGLRGRR